MAQSAVKDFVRLIDTIDHSKRRAEVFRDFCELSYCAHAKRMAPSRERADELERAYMAVVGRYRDKDDIRRMPELLAIATTSLAAGGADFLGNVAGELGTLDGKLGQFFTPYEVSRLMAEINLMGAAEIIDRQGYITVSEPAAGAGGLLIAAADVLTDQGFDPAVRMWFEAVELNQPTFHMLYLQTSLRGLAGRVIHGNSLSLESYSAALTPMASTFVAKHGNPFAHANRVGIEAGKKREIPPPAEAHTVEKPFQLSLF